MNRYPSVNPVLPSLLLPLSVSLLVPLSVRTISRDQMQLLLTSDARIVTRLSYLPDRINFRLALVLGRFDLLLVLDRRWSYVQGRLVPAVLRE